MEKALALYRGDLLAADRHEPWAEAPRSELQERYLDALTRLAGCRERLGRFRQAITCCQQILHTEPHREVVIRQLMGYQWEAGGPAQALATYREGERALREVLDVVPSAQTLALRDEIAKQGKQVARLDPRRLAVLPLANYSPDPEDAYIADGMTEELIESIAKARDLRVVARTSVMRFKGTARPISQIARELGVGTVLEGSVRRIGERMKISAQLVDGRAETHLWAEHYDLDVGGVLEVQGEIARRVAQALELELLSGERAALRVAEARAYQAYVAYLKGRHFLENSTRETLDRAMGHFEEALKHDPKHARALTGLADAWCSMTAYTTAKEACTQARE